ncbi:hypothetical protein TIFTF001_034626 [Ficus carica]|uniref:FAD-binding PCMH-type domain-containing protein n=1 Tax=Ficus carica TaxID=3494 RepID=A0AA88E0U5_FICCA|nr:hypothetical protein TIFTF001_034611 [Ficus carica]GMN65558.1 hypothetical protein TIFTF001_034626 [Ficus carica]
MKYSEFYSFFPCFIALLFSLSLAASAHNHHEHFLHCLSHHISNTSSISNIIYTPINPSYASILNSTIMNSQFAIPPFTPKPLVIITPFNASEVEATVICSKKYGLQIRTRSGGHDAAGLSYLSPVPYVILDLRNLRSVEVDVEDKTAWVQAGATLGEVYFRIFEKSSTLGFSAGFFYTIGVGGHFSGGGFGILLRKYGLAADNILDAHIVDAKGRFLDRKSMGEDLFWAIRGGGAASFGVVLAWKIRLVPVPPKLTTFSVVRDLEKPETKKLVHQWQYVANKFDEDMLFFVRIQTANSTSKGNTKPVLQAYFVAVFLGKVEKLLPLIQESFPKLGLVKEDCVEISWIQAIVLYTGFPLGTPPNVLLDRSKPQGRPRSFVEKSDFVQEPIQEDVLEKAWKRLYEEEVGIAALRLFPFGAKLSEIPESEIPFPHRAGNLYAIDYIVTWDDDGNATATKRHWDWIRSVHAYMTPYVSKNPRGAYLNFRDLDLGRNNDNGTTSYAQASTWGRCYFKNNFDRLVHVKTKVDPTNFFRNEQSIPSLPLRQKKGGGKESWRSQPSTLVWAIVDKLISNYF